MLAFSLWLCEATKAAERTLRQAKSLIEDHFHIDEALENGRKRLCFAAFRHVSH